MMKSILPPASRRGGQMITQCSHCQAKFKARADRIGKEANCPQCKQPFTVLEFIARPKAPAGGGDVEKLRRDVCSNCGTAMNTGDASRVYEDKAVCVSCYKQLAPAPSVAVAPAGETPGAETLSDTVYVYSVVCALVIAVASLFLGQLSMRERDLQFVVFGGVLIAMGAALGIYSTVVRLVMYHKMWAAIGDGETRMSPGRAVGLLLVPVLNVFWAIYMFLAFATEYASFAKRHSLQAYKLSKGLFLQYALLWIFLDISLVALYILPSFGIGNVLFGRVYASFGSGGDFRYVVMAWKMSNIVCTLWLFIAYTVLSIRICRAVNEI